MKRKLSIILAILLVLAVADSVLAAKSIGYEEVACTSGAANTLTAATITSLVSSYSDMWASVQVADFPIAYLTNGSAPTAATKKTAQVGDIIWLESVADMRAFQAIGIGGTSNLAVTYFSGAVR